MKKSLAATSILLALTPLSVHAEEGHWYVGVDLGAAFGGDGDLGFSFEDNDGPDLDDLLDGTDDIDSFDEDGNGGFLWSVGVGYEFANIPLRAELEFRDRELNAGDGVDTRTVMLSGFYDFRKIGPIQPYLKAGIGIGINDLDGDDGFDDDFDDLDDDMDDDGSDDDDDDGVALPLNPNFTPFPGDTSTDLAWAIGGGLACEITQHIIVDVEYQYLDAGDVDVGIDTLTNVTFSENLDDHEITLGLRYRF